MRNALATAAALSVLFTACFSAVIERQCEKDLDCGSGWRCVAQTCIPGSGGVGGGSATAGGGSAVGGGSVGGGGTNACNGSNCAGCCSGDICIPSSVQNASACGVGGAQCLACNPGGLCKAGACEGGSCDRSTCTGGCCLNNQCVPTPLQNGNMCGLDGQVCAACPNGACAGGKCTGTLCTPATCPSGCCLNGTCTMPTPQACGRGGAQCVTCGAGQRCDNGMCSGMASCNAATCPNGCCAANICIPFVAQSGTNCGRGGQACMTCSPGSVCQTGSCVTPNCGPSTCMGCCFFGTCTRGNDDFACGAGGAQCLSCPSGSQCLNGQCVGCGPATCPTGCCQFGFCQPGTLQSACGIGGQSCQQCPAGNACQFQKCTPVTNAAIGSACLVDSDCQSISPLAFCKQFTSTGNGVYQGGYCTLRCGGGTLCPGNSSCLSAPTLGESDQICLANCSAMLPCRQPGYACYSFGAATNACWIFPTPTLDGGVPVPDGGSALPTGAACTDNFQCQPPASAFCIPQTLGMLNTGYLNGYCSRTCGATMSCPSGTLCITELFGMAVQTTCKQLCFNPGSGQGICRPGYICIPSPTGLTGWCGPRCTNQTFPCPSGGMCNMATGYCQ